MTTIPKRDRPSQFNRDDLITNEQAPSRILSDVLPLTNIRALVVDNDPDSCQFLTFLLGYNGASVTATKSASVAIQAIEKSNFNILLSAIEMPDMDGYTLIRAIRAQTFLPHSQVPAIAITAHMGEIYQQQAITAGFQRYMIKPIAPDSLISLIVELVPQSSDSRT